MKSKLRNLKKAAAFTLVELIIVIAVITILAGIVIVAINPAAIFANARNGQRANDLTTLQAAVTKYIAESPTSGTARTLNNTFGNYGASSAAGAAAAGTLISGPGGAGGAYSSPAVGACPNGSTGTGLIAGATLGYSLITGTTAAAASSGNVDLAVLINNGYLPSVPKDPQQATASPQPSGYRVCIDTLVPTTNNNNLTPGKLVIYAPGTENGATVPYVVI